MTSKNYSPTAVTAIREQIMKNFAQLALSPKQWMYMNHSECPEYEDHIVQSVEARESWGSLYPTVHHYLSSLAMYETDSSPGKCEGTLNSELRELRVSTNAKTAWRKQYGISMLNTENTVIVVYDWTRCDKWSPGNGTETVVLHPGIHVKNADKTAIEHYYSVQEVDEAVQAITLLFKPFTPLPEIRGCRLDTFKRERASDPDNDQDLVYWNEFECNTAIFLMEWRQDMYRREVSHAPGVLTLYPSLSTAYAKHFAYWRQVDFRREDATNRPKSSDKWRLRMPDAIVAWDHAESPKNYSDMLSYNSSNICGEDQSRFLALMEVEWKRAGGHPFDNELKRQGLGGREGSAAW
jgi:hypothetical protein